MNLLFIYGVIFGCILCLNIAVFDIKLFKDKMLMKKIKDYRIYLYSTAIETIVFCIGYIVGVSK